MRLYNTLTKRKEEFVPLKPGHVGMYNCGPTVYSFAHIGNFASFLMGDVLRRYLEYSGYSVKQIMNITDVGHLTEDDVADAQGEDKMAKAARERQLTIEDIAQEYETAFHEDRRRLNCLDAHEYPRATEHVKEMIEMIVDLLDLGLAYIAEDQVYFEIEKFADYGILSGNTTEQLMAGARVAADPNKRNPLDFTLWKKDPDHLMKWPSPWGEGFPGWHIECSAMSRKYLGEQFDIHTGGEDNIFPHHECEIAQSSGGDGKVFARYWVHRRHIMVDGKKMSKSAGNFYTVRDLLKQGYDGLEIRYALISTYYGANSNFTVEGLKSARKNLAYLREFRARQQSLPEGHSGASEVGAVDSLAEEKDAAFRVALDDDLNTSAAFAAVRDFCREAYKICTTRAAGERAISQLIAWDSVLGVLDPVRSQESNVFEEVAPGLTAADIEVLLEERKAARERKDYAASDRIRDALHEKGIAIKDGPDGTRWQVV